MKLPRTVAAGGASQSVLTCQHDKPQPRKGNQVMSQDDISVSRERPEKKPPRLAIVIAATVVISLALLGWYILVGYVVTITGSARDLADIAKATAHLINASLVPQQPR
jgi:hypothetical protein